MAGRRRRGGVQGTSALLVLVAACVVAAALPALVRASAPAAVDLSGAPKVNEGVVGSPSGTDAGSIEREGQSMNAQARRTLANAQKFEFQAEVNRLMDILINSLYSNKDIFLRELISNASDALDKIRFLSLTDKSVLGEDQDSKLEIQIALDRANKVLTIRDRGIGMTKDDLIKNLGTIAKSGTSAFLEQMQKGGDVNLIGQFGVGFYSVYLVADWVEVVTKHNDDSQYVWASSADGGFSIAEDTENEPLGRGTMIKLHLKPEALEYTEEDKLRELVSRYSEFINFPIYMLTEKEVEVPVEEEEEQPVKEEAKEEAEADAKEDEKDDDVEDEDEEDEDEEEDKGEDKPKKTKKVKQPTWDLLNDAKAIWLRSPKDVSSEEYHKFYKAVSKDHQEPLSWIHFKAEGDLEFKAVLFVPRTVPFDFYDKYYEKGAKGALKLYVRRVFITDDADMLLPRWLGFLRGIVDSDTLSLNVSREMLQASAMLKTIKKKIVRKVLDMIKKAADDEASCRRGDNDPALAEKDSAAPGVTGCEMYGKFWEQYGRSLKLGAIEDTTNRNRIAKLLRFHTSKSLDKLTSFEEYIERMKEGQKDIYFLAGSSKEEIGKSPFVEQLLKKGYEVIYFTDVLDEYVMQHMLDFEDKKFVDVSKEGVKMADVDEKEKKRDKELKAEFKDLTVWWKKVLGDEVASVRVTNRLTTTPCVVVAGKFGQSANMERIMRAQAFANPNSPTPKGQRQLEINPRHPLIRGLREAAAAQEGGFDAEVSADSQVAALARLLYDSAVLESGYAPNDAKGFTARLQELVGTSLNVPKGANVEDDHEAEEAAEAATKPEADEDDKAEL